MSTWRAAFLITGSFTVAWLAVWLAVYRAPRQHPLAAAAHRVHLFSPRLAPARIE